MDYQEIPKVNEGSNPRVNDGSNTESKLKRLYLCWSPLKKAFMNACRLVIGANGCHSKGSHGGILLTAVGIDTNNCIFLFAYAIVEKEKKKTWLWFLELLGHDLNIVNSHCYTFMSDKQKGLIDAVAELFPNASHKFCVRHLYDNFKGEHKGLVLKDLLWKAVRATTVPIFTRVMAEIKEVDCKAYDCSSILEARSKFVVTMLEKIRLLLMEIVQKRRDVLQRHNGPICPENGYRKSDLSGIPCAHVVAVTNFLGQEPEKYVHQYYKVETYLKIYDNMLTPINGREMWPRTEYAKLLPPDVKKRAGGPKQNKRKETEAPIQGTKLGRQGTKMTCNSCGKVGHNRRSCKVKGRFNYMQESQAQGSQTESSQPQSQLTAETLDVKRHMRQKKLAVKRRVVQGSQSTPSPMSSTSTPKEGQMMWRGKLVYNASGIKSASTGQKEGVPT
ncbi:uncharacterized protein LOC114257438 [Camellia sinensis]|uniref:uncharacterized protein LOC114257438 n=1 Tax=Camellia sinensis TaxID=4442 RepID=UPI001036EACE|nr:uncharacterized protein LOC114257438 [Camellia sinensis]